MKNIVIIGGGTGTYTLLMGLRKFPVNNSVIVSTADDGGSTGRLRAELGVLPPGDIRQCLLALSYTEPLMRDLFAFRFNKGSLSGHTVGNIVLAALEKVCGDPATAIAAAAKLLNVRGQVVPVTLKPTHLSAKLSNGRFIKGEHAIDEPRHNGNVRIKSLQLSPRLAANPRGLTLIKQADAIIFGPGDLFTSTIPNLLVPGIRQAIVKSRAQKILVANIMTKHGQTNDFQASDFVKALEQYVKLDTVVVNSQRPAASALAYYRKHKAGLVEADAPELKKLKVKVAAKPLLSKERYRKLAGDSLQRSYLRHDSDKTARLIWQLLN